ncbi:MAG: molecular chaperone HtpG, partial [Gammaproteobacteria bacterium]|nr:molecular chaperone HtpG [Gammaproteobacteria bacterium]
NGIGMSQQEAIDHLGTIAKSGTKEFMGRLSGDQKADAQLIGQFGVGFYSGFIVADRITVESRRAGLPADQGVRWTSGGAGDFEVETITRPQRGTSVTLHLREDAEDYLNTWKLKSVIAKYSDHISLPIRMRKEEWKEGEDNKGGEMVLTDEWETVNQASALWSRPRKDITTEQYQEFYKQISHDSEPPLSWSHNRVEGSTEYTQLLYIPSHAPFDLWNREKAAGVKLYVKRVFIMDDAEALLPVYLRFVKGVIDSADLPLNVSRELLQESRDVRAIREGSAKRVLSMLEDLARLEKDDTASEEDRGKYAKFHAEFGAVIKEGLGEDFGNRERLAKLLRFASTSSDTANVSFADYKARMKEGQDAIYYMTGESRAKIEESPHLESFLDKGYEVLILPDPVDEIWCQQIYKHKEFEFKSISKGAVELGTEEEKKAAEEKRKEQEKEHQSLLALLKDKLKDHVKDVRLSNRLTSSAACLVTDGADLSPQLEQMMRQMGQDIPMAKRILELNPDHAVLQKLHNLFDANSDDPQLNDYAQLLFGQAVLAEGGDLPNPGQFSKLVADLMVKAG